MPMDTRDRTCVLLCRKRLLKAHSYMPSRWIFVLQEMGYSSRLSKIKGDSIPSKFPRELEVPVYPQAHGYGIILTQQSGSRITL